MRAFAGPVVGEPKVGIGTGSSRSLVSGGLPSFDAFASATASASELPFFRASTIILERPRLYEQLGSFTRHSATFMPQPQEQSKLRSACKARVFLMAVNP